jgi:hypothetical protein
MPNFFRFLSRRDKNQRNNSTGINSTNASDLSGLNSPNTTLKLTGINQTTPSYSNSNNKHVKLNGCEDLKESIEHYNHRCQAIKKIREEEQTQFQSRLNNNFSQNNNSNENRFSIFKSFNNKNNKHKANSKNANNNNNNSKALPSKDSIECAVFFLDETQEHFFIPKKSLGSKLLEQVNYHLDLLETDYFGLQFSDTHNVKHWLDPTKPIKKQCKIGPPYQFFFRVKFYTAEPNNLKEELTRYFYFLQLKQDLRSGRLCVSTYDPICAELCSLILQEELGDYDPDQHSIETVSEFRFLPDTQQTEQFEENIFKKYSQASSHRNMSPAEAELTFLNKAKWLEMYGVDMHQVYGRDQNEYKLGLTPSGILVFEECAAPESGENSDLTCMNNKIGLFYWPKIERVSFSKKKFTILVAEDDSHGFKQEHTFIFHLIDEKACKHLWKCAVEYHAFFRLRTSPRQLMMMNVASGGGANGGSNSSNGLFNGFIRRGSRFRGPERTEYQTLNMQRLTTPRRSVQFERKPSQRFSRRASYAVKRRQINPPNQDLNQPSKTSNMTLMSSDPKINSIQTPNGDSNTITINSKTTKPVYSIMSNSSSSELSTNSSIQTTSNLIILNNCCKLQQSSNGAEHDMKCNLYKAHLMMNNQKQFKQRGVSTIETQSCGAVSASSSGEVLPSSSGCSSSSSCEKNIDTIDNDNCDIDDQQPILNSFKNKNILDENVLNEKLTDKESSKILLKKSNSKIGMSSSNNINNVSSKKQPAVSPRNHSTCDNSQISNRVKIKHETNQPLMTEL